MHFKNQSCSSEKSSHCIGKRWGFEQQKNFSLMWKPSLFSLKTNINSCEEHCQLNIHEPGNCNNSLEIMVMLEPKMFSMNWEAFDNSTEKRI